MLCTICTIPTVQYYVRAISDEWLGAEALHELSFAGLILPERMPPHTGTVSYQPGHVHTQPAPAPVLLAKRAFFSGMNPSRPLNSCG